MGIENRFLLLVVPTAIIHQRQVVVFYLEFIVVLANQVVHIDVGVLQVDAILQVLEHLIQYDLTALLDDLRELDLKLVLDEGPELTNELVDDVRELPTLQNQIQVRYFQIYLVDVNVNALVIEVETQIKAQVDVIKDGPSEPCILEQLNVTDHIVLEEKVEPEVLNFEIEC